MGPTIAPSLTQQAHSLAEDEKDFQQRHKASFREQTATTTVKLALLSLPSAKGQLKRRSHNLHTVTAVVCSWLLFPVIRQWQILIHM